MSFEEGVALSFISGTLIAAGPIVFGVPFAPGWITPAYPIVIGVFATMGFYLPTGAEYQVETFQFMAAICIEFTILVAFLGMTGLSEKIVNNIPNALKSGIILGAAVAAFYQVFFKEFDAKYMDQPIAMTIAIVLCILTTFSDPFKKLASKNVFFQKISSLGQKQRPDEPLKVDSNRFHLSIAVRNLIGLIFNPNFPTQGALWTGVHVVVAERWKKGPNEMPSIFDGLGSYYLMAIPFLYVTLPFITLMEPLMNIALNLTLVLTGFACAYVALAIPKTNAEMASALFISLLIAFTGEYVWLGLLIGIFLSIFVVGKQTSSNQS